MKLSILLILCYVFVSTIQANHMKLKLWGSDYTLPYFFYMNVDSEVLKDSLYYFKLSNVDIVLAQGILESGNFKSNTFKRTNNLFGLSRKGNVIKFKHWTESVKYYQTVIQSRYHPPNENYYSFLERIGYAKDKEYINKLKEIENQID